MGGPEGSRHKSLRDLVYLALEQGQGDGQQQGLRQGVDRLEHADVLDQGLVPQEAQNNRHDHNVNQENDHVIDEILLGAGLENVQHLLLTERNFWAADWSGVWVIFPLGLTVLLQLFENLLSIFLVIFG